MIKDVRYNRMGGRNGEILSQLSSRKVKPTVIDVGASYNPWAAEWITATVDLNDVPLKDTIQFRGDITNIIVWENILKYVAENGKFDYCICTHTLEDISSPILVVTMLSRIAKEGFVGVPSKYIESKHNGGPCRGWLHHRWIFNKEDDIIVAYPKLPFTEYLKCLQEISNSFHETNEELSFCWEDTCDIKAVNGDFFPSDNFAIEIYNNLLDKK